MYNYIWNSLKNKNQGMLAEKVKGRVKVDVCVFFLILILLHITAAALCSFQRPRVLQPLW